MERKFAVIGVGNMAKSIISGIKKSNIGVSKFYLYDVNASQYTSLLGENTVASSSIKEAVESSDCI